MTRFAYATDFTDNGQPATRADLEAFIGATPEFLHTSANAAQFDQRLADADSARQALIDAWLDKGSA